jgi:hypothetical protein
MIAAASGGASELKAPPVGSILEPTDVVGLAAPRFVTDERDRATEEEV